jgi:hypothetical protein
MQTCIYEEVGRFKTIPIIIYLIFDDFILLLRFPLWFFPRFAFFVLFIFLLGFPVVFTVD